MGDGFYTPLSNLLLKHGCSFVRNGKGSHEIWLSPITNKKFPVSFTVKSRSTANAILKAAGIEQKL